MSADFVSPETRVDMVKGYALSVALLIGLPPLYIVFNMIYMPRKWKRLRERFIGTIRHPFSGYED